MALVDYSGSESSDEEESVPTKQPTKSKNTSNKPTFQKVVDSSEPHKIRISLPEPSKSESNSDAIERPAKRAKLGSSGSGGFNSLLPAPKRAAAPNTTGSLSGLRKGGLGSGVNLKTGAAPGFSRDPEPDREDTVTDGAVERPLNASGLSGDQTTREISNDGEIAPPLEKQVEESKPKGKITIFKPLSVARKPPKKKIPPLGNSSNKGQITIPPQELKPAPKISLFTMAESHETPRDSLTTTGTYEPVVYKNETPIIEPTSAISQLDPEGPPKHDISNPPIAIGPQSLDSIASDLNLSASAKRQLLGRQKNNPSAINVVNFNTDEEYKANEEARQAGEQVQHNPVRAIAPGKHSLKQLVNMGTTQADALEESFASGRRNRSEAGSKYGW